MKFASFRTTPSFGEGEKEDDSLVDLLLSSYLPLRHPLRSYFSLIWIEGQKIDCMTMKNFCKENLCRKPELKALFTYHFLIVHSDTENSKDLHDERMRG